MSEGMSRQNSLLPRDCLLSHELGIDARRGLTLGAAFDELAPVI